MRGGKHAERAARRGGRGGEGGCRSYFRRFFRLWSCCWIALFIRLVRHLSSVSGGERTAGLRKGRGWSTEVPRAKFEALAESRELRLFQPGSVPSSIPSLNTSTRPRPSSLAMSFAEEPQPVASTSAAPAAPEAERQITIRLSTKDLAYSVPSTRFQVPARFRRFHLSELINKVLENCELALFQPRLFSLLFTPSSTAVELKNFLRLAWGMECVLGHDVTNDMRNGILRTELSRYLERWLQSSSLSDLNQLTNTPFVVPTGARLLTAFTRNAASPIPFDFLINSSLLRSSLGEYCASSGTSEEVTLEIEYLPSTLPPQLESTLPSEDWVSDVSVGVRGCVLAGSGAHRRNSRSCNLRYPSLIFSLERSSLPPTLAPSRSTRARYLRLRTSPLAVTTSRPSRAATFPIPSAPPTSTGSPAEVWTASDACGSTR